MYAPGSCFESSSTVVKGSVRQEVGIGRQGASVSSSSAAQPTITAFPATTQRRSASCTEEDGTPQMVSLTSLTSRGRFGGDTEIPYPCPVRTESFCKDMNWE